MDQKIANGIWSLQVCKDYTLNQGIVNGALESVVEQRTLGVQVHGSFKMVLLMDRVVKTACLQWQGYGVQKLGP